MTAAVQPEAAAPPAHIAATARMMESRSMSSIPGSQLRIGGMEGFGQGWQSPAPSPLIALATLQVEAEK